jgi:glutamate carboxypeptidase
MDFDEFIGELEELVNTDSGSRDPEGVAVVVRRFAGRFTELGWEVRQLDLAPGAQGPSLLAARRLDDRPFDLLIVLHADTVFPAGEAQRRPFAVDGGRLRGPGVADMKTGCLFAWHAIRELEAERRLPGRVAVFINGEHEISCPNTRAVIEDLARASRIVITAEPARASGAYVKRRKGVARYRAVFTGRAAHAGVAPETGACAVTELAHFVIGARELAGDIEGAYVNPGVVRGGSVVNAVPAAAELQLDARFVTVEDGERIDGALRARAANPRDGRVHIELSGGITRPPMVPTRQTDELCEVVEAIGREHGVRVTWAFSGGGSDASFAAALGVPSLCGLAAVGGGYHTEEEYVETADLPARFAVFKEIVRRFAAHELRSS